MFYIIRIIFIIILILPVGFFVIRYFKKQVANGKKYTKLQSYVIVDSIVLFVFLLSALSFVSFEAPFIRFDTVEDALKYKWIDTKNITIHNENDCAFAVRGRSDLYAFDKNDDGYSYVNYRSKIHHYYVYNNDIYIDLYAVYQKSDNKTFYLMNYRETDYQEGYIDCGSLDFHYFAQPEYELKEFDYFTNMGIIFQEYAVCDGEPLETINLRYGDLQETLIIKK